jgi:uncharacterized protein YjiS (DUF1127 family)
MTLKFEYSGTLRMAGARGTTLEVLDGRVWITEAGRAGDAFVARGTRYSVAGDGVVLIGAETRARISVRAKNRIRNLSPWSWLRQLVRDWTAGAEARRTARELEALSDHRLRDLGIRRDQIASVAQELYRL